MQQQRSTTHEDRVFSTEEKKARRQHDLGVSTYRALSQCVKSSSSFVYSGAQEILATDIRERSKIIQYDDGCPKVMARKRLYTERDANTKFGNGCHLSLASQR